MPNKRFLIDGTILLCLIIVSFFFLPTSGLWSLLPAQVQSENVDKIISYQHPLIPTVTNNIRPELSANSYILIDTDTNSVLLSKNEKLRIYPASITKLATALTALNVYSLDEVITVSEEYKEGKIMELGLGEKITVKSLVEALLVYSANDAAFNLATNYQKGLSDFINQMNLIIKKYNLRDTNFINYDGIHHENHYSTVYDLSQLGRISIKNPIVREIVKNKYLTVTSIDGQIKHELISTNELLGVIPEIEGLKTGWTPEAGGCFISLINLNGHGLISVVAQSEDRFTDTKKIIDWAKNNLAWESYKP